MSIEHQLRRYIVYTCKKCNWQTAILAEWADLKPKRCPNKKCNCFFLKEPDQLDVKLPKNPPKKKAPSAVRKKTKTTAKKKSSTKKKEIDERRPRRDKEETGSSSES